MSPTFPAIKPYKLLNPNGISMVLKLFKVYQGPVYYFTKKPSFFRDSFKISLLRRFEYGFNLNGGLI